MKRFGLSVAAICLVAVFATACGGSSGTSSQDASRVTAAASAATITIANMNYGEPITVSPGAAVTIKNDDSVEHSVTSDAANKFDVDVDGHGQGTLTAPDQPGKYPFHCSYHPSMHGALIVQ